MEPFGTSRSRVCRDHALIAPESFVRAPLPGWRGALGVVLVAPALGARFTQYLALLEAGGTAAPAAPGVERVVYVLEGSVELKSEGAGVQPLGPGGYAYLPPTDPGALRAVEPSRLCVFE